MGCCSGSASVALMCATLGRTATPWRRDDLRRTNAAACVKGHVSCQPVRHAIVFFRCWVANAVACAAIGGSVRVFCSFSPSQCVCGAARLGALKYTAAAARWCSFHSQLRYGLEACGWRCCPPAPLFRKSVCRFVEWCVEQGPGKCCRGALHLGVLCGAAPVEGMRDSNAFVFILCLRALCCVLEACVGLANSIIVLVTGCGRLTSSATDEAS